jgi:predicted phosphodiesterase
VTKSRVLGGGLALLATSCLVPTPFGSQPEQRDLNARALHRLAASSDAQTAPRREFTFAALGDTHAEYDDLVKVARAINRRQHIDFVAHMGDMTDFGLLQEYAWAHDALSELERPLFVTIGNHDAISSGAAIYREMYGPLEYSFVHQRVKFIFFNSNSLEFPDSVPNRTWLTEQIQNSGDARAVVLVTHHPPWSSDAPRATQLFYAELLQTGRVAAWIHGHIATFQLVRYHGVPILQCGTFQHWREYALVTLAEESLSFQRCNIDQCSTVEPSENDAEEAP